MLRDITASTRNHYHLGGVPFSICQLVPTPFRVALQTIALHEGWPVEMLLLSLCSNVGWLEHVETRLRASQDEEHARTPNIPLMVGGDPSVRKSSLERYASRTLMQGDHIPVEIRDGTVTTGDGTIKGHRDSLQSKCRSGIVTSDITTVYGGVYSYRVRQGDKPPCFLQL